MFLNTWARAFDLQKISFESQSTDIMIGEKMAQDRGIMAQFGGKYCIVLPKDQGVKCLLWAPKDLGAKIGKSDK